MSQDNTETLFTTRSPAETWALAKSLLDRLPDRALFALHGDLGSGKTCFVQGIAKALGISRLVTSPTFTMINSYRGPRRLIHVDLYRLAAPDEASAIGLEECIEEDAVVVIEWADRAATLIPDRAVHIYFGFGRNESERIIRVVMPATGPNETGANTTKAQEHAEL